MAKFGLQVVRLGVGNPDGRRSSVWRAWARRAKSDVYVTNQSIGGAVKLSVHASVMLVSFTSEYHDEMLRLGTWTGPRNLEKLPRPVVRDDQAVQVARIVIPEQELRAMPRGPSEDKPIQWQRPPEPGDAAVFSVLLVGRAFAESALEGVCGTLELNDGQRAVVACEYHPIWQELRVAIEDFRAKEGTAIKLDARPNMDFSAPAARIAIVGVNASGFFTFLEAASR